MSEQETKAQRLNRELGELQQELRILLPGVQVLFAFLLTVPFSQRFDSLSGSERGLFVTALSCAAAASAFLIAPGAMHRLLFREHEREWLIVMGNRFAIVGTVFLAVTMGCALYLVVEVIYGSKFASGIAAGLGLVFVTLWYVVPLVRRARTAE
jgi:hypothetical protein